LPKKYIYFNDKILSIEFILHISCFSQIRVLINTSGVRPNFKADLLVLRMASWNQILDPWLYIVLRKEMLVRVYNFYRKKRYGVVSETPNHSTESSSGSLRSNHRLQTLTSMQKRLLKKVNSTDSSTSNANEDKYGSSGRINSPSLLRKT
jgi:hypothetical protein